MALLLAVALAAACCLLSAAPAAAEVGLSARPGSVHTLILTDCAKYQDWQTIAAAFAWRESGQPGKVTRIANCNERDTKAYSKAMLEVVNTHMAPQYAWNARLQDWYAAYNKPGALVDWLNKTQVDEEYVLLLDSDMLLRRPFLPKEFNLTKGWVRAPYYSYLHGVHNELAMKHIPEILPRNDTLAGPAGRRADMVGGPYFMHTSDLKRLAPLWLKWTETMRADMEAYKWAGDTGAGKGDRIWIAEMYGYAFGAAKANLWHKWSNDFMLYPGYEIGSLMPRTIHYGLLWHIDDWSFDKHWYFDFSPHKCPPWNSTDAKPKAGLFPPPPHPSTVKSAKKGEFMKRYQDLVAIQTIALVNAALCENYRKMCPASTQLSTECDKAEKLYQDTKEAILDMEWVFDCADHHNDCKTWAKRGECEKSRPYMNTHCRLACNFCTPKPPRKRALAADATSLTTAGKAPSVDQASSDGHVLEGQTSAKKAASAGTGEGGAAGGMGAAGSEGGESQGNHIAAITLDDATAVAAGAATAGAKAAVQGAAAVGDAAAAGAKAAAGTLQEAAASTKEAAAGTIQAVKGTVYKAGEVANSALEGAKAVTGKAASVVAGAADAGDAADALTQGQLKTAGTLAGTVAGGDVQQGHPLHPSAGGGAQTVGSDSSSGGSTAGSKLRGGQQSGAQRQGVLGQHQTDQQLRNRYPASTMKYPELVHRCTRLVNLEEGGLKACIRAAGLRLKYPGVEAPEATDIAEQPQVASGVKDTKEIRALGRKEGGSGAAASVLEGQQRAVQQDIADLHAVYHTAGGKFENMLLQRKHSGPSLPVAGLCVVGLVGVALLWRRRSRRGGSKVTHRNE